MKNIFSTSKTILLATAMLSLTAALPVHADGANPRVLPISSGPYGKTYGEWAAAWWQWALAIPADTNPLNDDTGENAGIGQTGPVWFLAGATTSTTTTRSLMVPAGKALFFPIANTVWVTYPTDPPMTIQEIRDVLTFVNSTITDVACEVDGVSVSNPRNYVAQSPVFSVTLPENNLFGVDAGTYSPCVDESFYFLLAPLSQGEHTIHFTSNNAFFGTVLDITYQITVR